MVKVTEIQDEKEEQNSVYGSEGSSRSGSTDSLDSIISEPDHESFFDRIAALVDIVPPTTRYSISSRVSKTFSALKKTSKFAGNVVWVVTTSALLVGLPLALILEDEAKIVAQEKEMLAQQAGAQQVRHAARRFFILRFIVRSLKNLPRSSDDGRLPHQSKRTAKGRCPTRLLIFVTTSMQYLMQP